LYYHFDLSYNGDWPVGFFICVFLHGSCTYSGTSSLLILLDICRHWDTFPSCLHYYIDLCCKGDWPVGFFIAVHFCTEVALLLEHCSNYIALENGEEKIILHEKSDGKKAATAASKHSRDDSDSSVEEMPTLEHVSGVKHDCSSVSKAKHRSQIRVHSIMDVDDKVSLGAANSNSSSETSVAHSEQVEVVAEVDYGDDIFCRVSKGA